MIEGRSRSSENGIFFRKHCVLVADLDFSYNPTLSTLPFAFAWQKAVFNHP